MPREHITSPYADHEPFPTELILTWTGANDPAGFVQLGIQIAGRNEPDPEHPGRYLDQMHAADILDMLYGQTEEQLRRIGHLVRVTTTDSNKALAMATPPSGVTNDDVRSDSDLELGTAVLQALRAASNEKGDPDSGRFNSLWISSLDRPGIQSLLRSLKRARNACFGADE